MTTSNSPTTLPELQQYIVSLQLQIDMMRTAITFLQKRAGLYEPLLMDDVVIDAMAYVESGTPEQQESGLEQLQREIEFMPMSTDELLDIASVVTRCSLPQARDLLAEINARITERELGGE